MLLQGSALDAFLAPDRTLVVYGGGVTTGSFVDGTEAVNNNGLSVSSYVSAGGTQQVKVTLEINPNTLPAVAIGTVIGAAGTENVIYGGLAISSYVLSGGEQNLETVNAERPEVSCMVPGCDVTG